MTMKAVSLEAGLGETFVRDMLERGRVPSVDKLLKLAHVVGATVSELLGENSIPTQTKVAFDPEKQLRSALLAYGVDRRLLDAALLAVEGFRMDSEDDEPPQSSPDQAETASASPRREKARAK